VKLYRSLICLFVLFACVFSQSSQPRTINDTIYIKEVVIQGNKRTDTDIVKHYLKIDTGMVFDSSLVTAAKKRLKSTDLFSKIDIITLIKPDGIHVYVILIEGLHYNVYDIGGEYYLYKYRHEEFWWRLRLGVEDMNFRGRMEVLRVHASIWDCRSLSVSWQKPLFPSLWYFSTSVYAEERPEDVRWIDHTSASLRLSIGRKFLSNSRAFLGVIPFYEKMIIYSYNADTTAVLKQSRHIKEVFTSLSSGTDFRDKKYDPESGFLMFHDLRTNSLYSGIVKSYYQYTGDFRFFFPFFFDDHKFASRLQIHMRNRNTGIYHPLQYGGDFSSLRGYFKNEFPHKIKINDALLFSFEYRFPILRFPPMKVPVLSHFSDLFSALEYRVDGALIFDYGRMAPSLGELFDPDGKIESGTGIGAGLRIMVPTIRKSAVIDVVWGEDPTTGRGDIHFIKSPTWHLYVDTFY